MSLLDTALDLVEHQPEPFIAPVPDAEQVRVWSVQDNIPYQFVLRDARPGWWIIEPRDKSRARIFGRAWPSAYLTYLAQLPRFYVLPCFRVRKHTWLCVPFCSADTAQRGWPNAEPRLLHLVRHSILPFDLTVARDLNGVLLYDTLDTRLGVSHSILATYRRDAREGNETLTLNRDFQHAFRVVSEHWQALRKEQERQLREARAERVRQEVEERRATTEEELRWHLDFSDALLVDWSEWGENYRVTWEYEGREYTMRVRRDMRIESAGICLAGRDLRQNLSSIVRVMTDRGY